MTKTVKQFFKKHQSMFGFLILLISCGLLLFLKLGSYPLIDIDETRYVGMSADLLKQNSWITTLLNGEPFLEKPPLYFWLNAVFFNITGVINPFTGRFMTAFLALFAVLFTYFFARKALGKHYALTSSLILLSSLWFLLFSHNAILDMGFMVMSMSAIYSAVLSVFCENKANEKYCWYFGWFFIGLAVLMKGLIGFIIPSMVVFLYFLSIKRVKDLFKPVNIIPGILLFLLVSVPWHYAIYQEHGMTWVNEYIIKHHFARFLDSEGLGRKQPFLFYIPIIIAGFIPWTSSFIATLVSGIKSIFKDLRATKNIGTVFSIDTNERKILLFASIYFLSVLLFFSISSSKLPSYILTVFPAISLLTAYYWWGYISYDKYEKGIKISTIIGAITFILVGIGALVAVNFVPAVQTIKEIALAKDFSLQIVIWVILIPSLSLILLKYRKKTLLFLSKIVFMIGIIYIATTYVFNYITLFGQNELENYALKAKEVENSELITFDFPNKYSVVNVFGRKVNLIPEEDFDLLNQTVNDAKSEKKSVFVIVKNKNYQNYKEKFEEWTVIEEGNKYSLLSK